MGAWRQRLVRISSDLGKICVQGTGAWQRRLPLFSRAEQLPFKIPVHVPAPKVTHRHVTQGYTQIRHPGLHTVLLPRLSKDPSVSGYTVYRYVCPGLGDVLGLAVLG